MGAGIATACLADGIPVVVKEFNDKFAFAATSRVEKNLGPKKAKMAGGLTVTTEYQKLSDVDIVIEAVLENPALKQKVFGELEAVCHSKCILATNTSNINIDLIGAGATKARADRRVIGAHFFSPAHKMPLLEIVRTETTSPKVIKDVLALRFKSSNINCSGPLLTCVIGSLAQPPVTQQSSHDIRNLHDSATIEQNVNATNNPQTHNNRRDDAVQPHNHAPTSLALASRTPAQSKLRYYWRPPFRTRAHRVG